MEHILAHYRSIGQAAGTGLPGLVDAVRARNPNNLPEIAKLVGAIVSASERIVWIVDPPPQSPRGTKREATRPPGSNSDDERSKKRFSCSRRLEFDKGPSKPLPTAEISCTERIDDEKKPDLSPQFFPSEE